MTEEIEDMAAAASAGEMPDAGVPGADPPDTGVPSPHGSGDALPAPVKALLHTEPAVSPDDTQYAEMEPAIADLVIGFRKVLSYLGAETDGGMPAIGNFVRAGYRSFTADADVGADDAPGWKVPEEGGSNE